MQDCCSLHELISTWEGRECCRREELSRWFARFGACNLGWVIWDAQSCILWWKDHCTWVALPVPELPGRWQEVLMQGSYQRNY
jgi:hypothetical protein